MRGQITAIKRAKGFGFIKSDEDADEYFFHTNDTPIENLREGDDVEFEPFTIRGKGKRARHVKVIS